MKKFTKQEILELYGQVTMGEISFSQMVEIMNERVSGANEPQYKDGDFVVNECGVIIIFKNKVGSYIYDHAYFSEAAWVVVCSDSPTTTPIRGYATEEQKKKILDELAKEGKRWNAEKKCVEDIPKPKFKIGDKVRIKDGISSETHRHIFPSFTAEMDELIEKELTVDVCSNGIVCIEESGYNLHEDWLEPYVEELKKGDLAIFWDSDQTEARIGAYNQFYHGSPFPHEDHIGNGFRNAIKFESKEQYKKLLKREI